MTEPEFLTVGAAFTQHYYSVFDKDRSGLSGLYRKESMLTFEGQQYLGTENIVTKLQSLPFNTVAHKVVTCDCQPMPQGQGVLVSVSGTLTIDGENPMKFAQCFNLLRDPANPGSFWVHNDIFRLNLG